MPHDLIVRAGTVVDGTGRAPFTADVGVCDGVIGEIGRIEGDAPEVIDADGLVVTPGYVDVHTHYDGQITWDPQIAPSSYHGVTTVVVGNCGVGFAPVRAGRQDFLIELMEGVEDIPGTALSEGIDWSWETFPEYLDALDRLRWALDVATQIPHAAVRAYVMDERGARNESARAEDVARMAQIVREGMQAGALGVSTSRILAHLSSAGEVVPGTYADEQELRALAGVLQDLGTGVFEVVPRGMDGEVSDAAHAEIEWMGRLAQTTRRPLTYSLVQTHTEPDRWREMLDATAKLRAGGAPICAQVANRPTGILIGLQTENHPFSTRPSYRELEGLPLSERVARLADPRVRARILAERNGTYDHPLAAMVHTGFGNMYSLGDPPDYEPEPGQDVESLAQQQGRSPEDLCLDLMLEHGGRNLLMFPFTNYVYRSMDVVHEMLTHEASVFGLGDGGAHCGVACDASGNTLMLSHWVRSRSRGPRVPIETAVRWMTSEPAELYGLSDRGRIAPGCKADLNVIDLDTVDLEAPEVIFDLPAGGRRLMQRARGYRATLVSGEVTLRDDQPTGIRPGRLVRGAR